MTKALILFFLLATASVIAFSQASAADPGNTVPTGSIMVRISKLRNTNGQLAAALFSTREGFPGKSAKALAKKFLPANDPKCEVVFDAVPYGSYAVSVYHDENSNGKLDTVFLIGMPKEGVGCSNNPKSSFGPPSFADAKFILEGREVVLNIDLKYL
jgi:uncharacterized protein (DUF2141 family)